MSGNKKSIIALLFTSNANFFDPELKSGKNLCRWLKAYKHQRKLCQHKKGLSEILQKTRQLTLESCQLQFEYKQWNCSTTHMKKFFKKMYRETAFMYSLATSAFMYTVVQACVEGKVATCKCASHSKSDIFSSPEFKWGGCSVNTTYASKFVEKFLHLKKKGDNPNNVMRHNSQVGLKLTRGTAERICKCHGLSGACTHRICWKGYKSFTTIAENLKQLYHNAVKIEPENSIHEIHAHKKRNKLVFLDTSPNFCDPHKNWGLSTVGRLCKDIDTCATLCCGRGYEVSTKTRHENCKCHWRNDTSFLELKCQTCTRRDILYYCK